MQPSDILLLNGAHGTGKTIACLNAACMALKMSDESRVVLCCPDETALIGTLTLIKRRDRFIQDSSQLLANLTVVAGECREALGEAFTSFFVEQKAMLQFTREY